MSIIEITAKIDSLKELEALIEEAKVEADNLRNEIKSEMLSQDVEVMMVGRYVVRWTSVQTQRFDSTAFKNAMPDMYQCFTKQTASRRFSIV